MVASVMTNLTGSLSRRFASRRFASRRLRSSQNLLLGLLLSLMSLNAWAGVLSIGSTPTEARKVLAADQAVLLNENTASDGRFYLAARLKNDTGLNLIFAPVAANPTANDETNGTDADLPERNIGSISQPPRMALVQIETGRWQSNGISGLLQLERATVLNTDLDLAQAPAPPSARNDALIGLAVFAAVVTIVVIARRRAIQRMPARGGLESMPEHELDGLRPPAHPDETARQDVAPEKTND